MDPDGVEEDYAAVRAYLDNPPYYGKSEYRNLKEVKQHAGPTCCYDPARKLWGTTCTDALQELVVSKKWEPIGLSRQMHAPLVRAAREYAFWNEADYVAGVEEAEAAKRKQEAAAEAAAKRTPASWVVAGSKSKRTKPPLAPVAPTAPAP